jgi:nucleotide-binding universal stress UspA family protein
MIRITRVLCPVDFSEISQHALDHASAIAYWYEAPLTLLYVFPNLPTIDMPPLVLEDSERDRLIAEMRRRAARVPSAVPIEIRVEQASAVHDEILAQAAASGADLIVLGTHGRSGFERLFLGSVTEKVIRKTACPTLVVPPRAPDVPADRPVRFSRILCPIDFSDPSLSALTYALNLAEEVDGRLTLLHVVEIPRALSDEPAAFDVDIARVRDKAAADARSRLRALIPEDARTYCTVETAVVEGRAHREILRHATVCQSELIVMGGHGHGALDGLLFGSTTHHVIRAADCPVLVVRLGSALTSSHVD